MKKVVITATKKDVYISDIADTKELTNTLVQSIEMEGSLNPSFEITGQIKELDGFIQGELFQKSEISGVLNNRQELLTGTLEKSSNSVTGEVRIPFGEYEIYSGSTEVTPSFFEQTLQTEGKVVNKDIKVFQIQTYETSNEFGGLTFII